MSIPELVTSVQSVFDCYLHGVQSFRKAHLGPRSFEGLNSDGFFARDMTQIIEHRMRYAGWRPSGIQNASGSCRFIETLDRQWVAVHLARRSDFELLSLVLDLPQLEFVDEETWMAFRKAIARWNAEDLLASLSDLGVPLSLVGEVRWPGALDALPVHHRHVTKDLINRTVRFGRQWQVVDLSSLWAGPLCSRLLTDAGFHVTTIESVQRPDPTKQHHPEFYADLHSKKNSLTIDFDNPGDFQQLSELLASCDVVVTGSRRRAFDHLGFDIDRVLASSQPSVWVSITGYGYWGPGELRVGFGDDCAAAGGLVAGGSFNGGTAPGFMGDAIADPITGVVAAAAVLDWLVGGDSSEKYPADSLASSVRESPPQQGLHLQISLAECANWVSRGGQVSTDRRDWSYEGRL